MRAREAAVGREDGRRRGRKRGKVGKILERKLEKKEREKGTCKRVGMMGMSKER